MKAETRTSTRAKKRVASARSADLAPIRYIESSALVAALLEGESAALAALRIKGRRVTSALTIAEAARAILRARTGDRLTAEGERAALRGLRRFERRCYVVAITEAVLSRVRRPFPVEPIRTLDAVHLATAELLGDQPLVI
jgi:predicted nucleic acid-binding protein